jgi:DNA mismatch repair protein MutL
MLNTKIKILPEFITNKIAAGEVVQRPESVVKELLENAIDAGGKNIDLYIKQAGKSLIQVVDDGIGMSEEDALMCIHKHATSKISQFEDIENVLTFGFRGEALSSISSVSQLEIKTETKDQELGTLIKVDGGGEVIKEKGAFAKGTSIAVKNLFFNTPARRNFLKSNATELKHVIDTFKKISLSQPSIHFRFITDDEIIFDYSETDLKGRIRQVFADNIDDAVVDVKEMTDYISLHGVAAKPSYLIKSKGDQYLFINKRFVISKTVNHAVFTAYENILEKGDYPFFVLFLELDPKKIDINVHPQKLEVKFEDEKEIYSFVQAVIKKSLGSYDLTPSLTFHNSTEDTEKLRLVSFQKSEKNDFSDRPSYNSERSRKEVKSFTDDDLDLLFSSINEEIKTNINAESPHPFESKTEKEIYHEKSSHQHEEKQDVHEHTPFLVSLHNKYILAQIKSGLMIIDQHIAHERILYEKALNSLSVGLPFSQSLLFPETISVDPSDYELLKELNNYLTKLGFELKFLTKQRIIINGVPSDIKNGTEKEILFEILDEYKENQRDKKMDINHNLAASYSCKAAIKAGDKLSEKEMRVLVDQLFATSMPYVCPHGRPIIIKLTLDEFDRRFGRT